MRGPDGLRNHLTKEYRKKTPGSRAVFHRAEKVMIEGGSHTIRLWRPYPFFAASAEGPDVRDVDGNDTAAVGEIESNHGSFLHDVLLAW